MTRTPDSKKSYNSSDDSRTNSTGYNPLKFFFAGKEYHCGKTTYYPSDDSYLLAECVKIGKGENVIDMGCGAGLQSLNALFLGAARVIAADINKNIFNGFFLKKSFLFYLKKKIFGETDCGSDISAIHTGYILSSKHQCVKMTLRLMI